MVYTEIFQRFRDKIQVGTVKYMLLVIPFFKQNKSLQYFLLN